ANWLDRTARSQEEKPDRAMELIGIMPGMVVADVGAGAGYMKIRLARGRWSWLYDDPARPARGSERQSICQRCAAADAPDYSRQGPGTAFVERGNRARHRRRHPPSGKCH